MVKLDSRAVSSITHYRYNNTSTYTRRRNNHGFMKTPTENEIRIHKTISYSLMVIFFITLLSLQSAHFENFYFIPNLFTFETVIRTPYFWLGLYVLGFLGYQLWLSLFKNISLTTNGAAGGIEAHTNSGRKHFKQSLPLFILLLAITAIVSFLIWRVGDFSESF